jgi:hypothetical protein
MVRSAMGSGRATGHRQSIKKQVGGKRFNYEQAAMARSVLCYP